MYRVHFMTGKLPTRGALSELLQVKKTKVFVVAYFAEEHFLDIIQ